MKRLFTLAIFFLLFQVNNDVFSMSYSFQEAVSVLAGVSPRGMAVGNVLGNNIPSLIVANFGSSTFIGQSTPSTFLNLQNSNVQIFSPDSSEIGRAHV
jgi:hypothetical protein